MVTITITPKLGPYGSGMKWAGFDVRVILDSRELEMSETAWNKYRIRFNKKLTIAFDQNGNPRLDQPGSKKLER